MTCQWKGTLGIDQAASNNLSEIIEEVGSAVTSCALYCAACVFGMIRMLITSQVLPVTVLVVSYWEDLIVTASGGRTTIIPVLECRDLYPYTVPSFSVLNVEIWRHTARSNWASQSEIDCFYLPQCRSLTYVSITYVQLKHRFVSSLHRGNGCTITQALLPVY